MEFVKPLEKVEVTEGQPATFTCQLAKIPKNSPVTWLKDGKPILADGKDVVMKAEDTVLSLHIPATVLDDEAEYSVVVGKVKSAAELLVDGKVTVNSLICLQLKYNSLTLSVICLQRYQLRS